MAANFGEKAPKKGPDDESRPRKMNRVGIHIDMTPMVDIAFLLLTFFMLTSVFSRPQTMEINLPPSDIPVEVAESNLLTLRVMQDGGIFWNMGVEAPEQIAFKDLRQFLDERNRTNSKLITLIKVDPKAKYHHMVDVMDELELAHVNRFSLAPMSPKDIEAVQKVQGNAG